MYGHFIQFTIPKIGQALVAVVLYLNFLKLPLWPALGMVNWIKCPYIAGPPFFS